MSRLRESLEEKATSGFIIITANWFHYDSRGFYIRTLKAFAIVGFVRARCRGARPSTHIHPLLARSYFRPLLLVICLAAHIWCSPRIFCIFFYLVECKFTVRVPGPSRVDDEVKPASAWPWRKFHPLCPPFLHVPSGNTW